MFVITLKKAHNCLSFWTVLPNVEPCGDNLEQNESSVKTANASPSSTTSQSGWAAAGICPRINCWIHGTNYCTRHCEFVPTCPRFFHRALNLEDMGVGTWICILDTCIIIFLVQYSWFRLFCYGYFVIGYLFGFCCIAELICNKMRSSEINLYYFEMQSELSEIDMNYLKFTWKFLKLTWKRCSDSSHVRLQQQTFNKILLDFDLITRDWKLTSHHVLSTPFLHQDYENQRYLKIFRSHLNQCSYAR